VYYGAVREWLRENLGTTSVVTFEHDTVLQPPPTSTTIFYVSDDHLRGKVKLGRRIENLHQIMDGLA
jgi:hypothetical protein